MTHSPTRRVAALVLELLLVLLVAVGGGGECTVVDGDAAAAHAAHGAHVAAHPADDAGGHAHHAGASSSPAGGHAHHAGAPSSPARGDAPTAPMAPDCVMSAACAPVLAAADVPPLELPAASHGDPADARPHAVPPSAVRQVEPPPPRA